MTQFEKGLLACCLALLVLFTFFTTGLFIITRRGAEALAFLVAGDIIVAHLVYHLVLRREKK